MKTQELNQEQVDRLSVFIEDHIEDEDNPFQAETMKDIFNKLPDSEDMIMKVVEVEEDGEIVSV